MNFAVREDFDEKYLPMVSDAESGYQHNNAPSKYEQVALPSSLIQCSTIQLTPVFFFPKGMNATTHAMALVTACQALVSQASTFDIFFLLVCIVTISGLWLENRKLKKKVHSPTSFHNTNTHTNDNHNNNNNNNNKRSSQFFQFPNVKNSHRVYNQKSELEVSESFIPGSGRDTTPPNEGQGDPSHHERETREEKSMEECANVDSENLEQYRPEMQTHGYYPHSLLHRLSLSTPSQDACSAEYLQILAKLNRLEKFVQFQPCKTKDTGSQHGTSTLHGHHDSSLIDASADDNFETMTTPTISSYGEEKLKDFQSTLDMICQAAMDPVIITDEFGKIKSVNNEMLSLFEYNLWEIVGKNVTIIMPPEYAKNHDKYLERYRLTKMKRIIGQVRTGIAGLKKSGTRISLKLKVQAITDIHGTVYIGVLKDVGRDEELFRIRDMLSHMLPKGYEEKITTGTMIAEQFRNGSVMFVDLVNFTKFSSTVEPCEIIQLLNEIFEKFDVICRPLKIEKIKTIGDAYMCAAGVTRVMYDAPIRLIEAAIQILEVMKSIDKLNVRIGIASGKVMSGVLKGDKLTFDIWGDTVNVASRMENHAPVGAIRVCNNTYNQTQFMYSFEMEELEVKGKGMMKTYVLKERKEL